MLPPTVALLSTVNRLARIVIEKPPHRNSDCSNSLLLVAHPSLIPPGSTSFVSFSLGCLVLIFIHVPLCFFLHNDSHNSSSTVLFGTGACSSISSLLLLSLSIITTSPLRRSPSILASSSFFRHGTATIISFGSVLSFPRCLLPDRSRESHAMLVPHDDFSSRCFGARKRSTLPHARQLVHTILSASDLPCAFADFPYCRSYVISM